MLSTLATLAGDEWRMARLLAESDMHLLARVNVQVLFSNSIKPDYRYLPSLKLNLSDRRLGLLVSFCQNFPLPRLLAVDSSEKKQVACFRAGKDTKAEPTSAQLKLMKEHVTQSPIALIGKPPRSFTQLSMAGSDQLASDHSDEEEDWWGHALDVPGFDNNVSASNTINSLMCFVLGEVVLHLSRSSDQAEKPYLMLRLEKLCADAALMEYGPAFQATISGIYLVDKLHIGATGEYLELLTSCATKDMVSIFYRKASVKHLSMCVHSQDMRCRSKQAVQSSSRTSTRWSTQLWWTSLR
ncbi:hypothetical protein MRX96_022638 [Rhipicephalus microplus]